MILLDEKREYEVRRDDTMKLMNLPVWQVQSLAADIEKANKAPTVFAEILVEGIDNVRKAQARLDQRIALLRHVEALRLYAAEHMAHSPQSCPTSPCHFPMTRAPASRSATKSPATQPTFAALRPSARKRTRSPTSIMKSRFRSNQKTSDRLTIVRVLFYNCRRPRGPCLSRVPRYERVTCGLPGVVPCPVFSSASSL